MSKLCIPEATRCPSCGELHHGENEICDECADWLDEVETVWCPVCGHPTDDEYCPACDTRVRDMVQYAEED